MRTRTDYMFRLRPWSLRVSPQYPGHQLAVCGRGDSRHVTAYDRGELIDVDETIGA